MEFNARGTSSDANARYSYTASRRAKEKNGLRVKALLGNYYFTSASFAEFANKSLLPPLGAVPRALALEKGALCEFHLTKKRHVFFYDTRLTRGGTSDGKFSHPQENENRSFRLLPPDLLSVSRELEFFIRE